MKPNKFLKIFSDIFLILNPVCGFLMFVSIFAGHFYWLFIFPLLGIIILNLKFHFYAYKEEHDKYEEWIKEFSKTHGLLGEFDENDVWKNNITGKIIYC